MQARLEQTSVNDTLVGVAALDDSEAEPDDAESEPESPAPRFTLVCVSSIYHASTRGEGRTNGCYYVYRSAGRYPMRVRHTAFGIVCPSCVGTQ